MLRYDPAIFGRIDRKRPRSVVSERRGANFVRHGVREQPKSLIYKTIGHLLDNTPGKKKKAPRGLLCLRSNHKHQPAVAGSALGLLSRTLLRG